MKIERAVLREIAMELRQPFESSAGTVRGRRVLLLTLSGEGLDGWAECVAGGDPSYTYETVDTAWHVLEDFLLPRVVGREVARPDEALQEAVWIRGHPMAKAVVEMATWDLTARAAGISLAQQLGGVRSAVPVGVSVGLEATDAALRETVGNYLAQGYARAKVKVKPGRDVEMLAALRERFPDASLMADANSAYTLEDLPRLRELDRLGLDMLEQPLAPDDFLDHARLQRELATPICLDESVRSARDAALALELGSCRVVNVKPGRVGGLAESRRIHDLLTSADVPVWCGGMLETGVGRAHNVALASLKGFTLPADLSASRRYWDRDIVQPEFTVRDGEMTVPSGPGIGVDVDVELIEARTSRVRTFP